MAFYQRRTMENFRIRWTEGGTEHISAVNYNRSSAERRASKLSGTDGVSNVAIVPVKPGK